MSATITDLFCGAGGSSIGAETAGGELRLALNHWERAIETHATNFQHADHDCNDVAALTTAQIRRYPHTDILLASPECTNHSLAKGAKRRKPQAASLWEDGPAGDAEQDRSRATMFDVWRFADQKQIAGHPYKAIVVENVVDAWKWGPNDDGSMFNAWLGFGKALGYEHEIVFLNSMFAGAVPQSRDRMYVVWWLKGMRRPNLKVSPLSWCPSCERLVDGQQTWKKPERPWGRYGAQYFFGCPECHGSVLPGVHPAATAIDWTLPAERIGDRKKPLAANTRKRIRRGLEKLAGEPFAIRLTHGGAPKPLTLPIVTLTQRHDMAKSKALVMRDNQRNSNGNATNDADAEAMRTICAGDRFGMVMANRANNVPKDADQEPTPPILTGKTVGVVMRNNTGGGEMSMPVHEPIRALTSRRHQSLLIPCNRGNEPVDPDRDPTQTLTTRDRVALLVPYTREGRPRDVDFEPATTVATEGPPAVLLTEDDIDACRFRMFQLHEIASAMAMRDHVDGSEYRVLGNKRERMAQYGNAVTPPAMELLVGRLLEVIG